MNLVVNRSALHHSRADINDATPTDPTAAAYPEPEELYGLVVAVDNDADGDGVFSDLEALPSAMAMAMADEEEQWVELRVSIYSKGTKRERERKRVGGVGGRGGPMVDRSIRPDRETEL